MTLPYLSILLPVKNEEKNIQSCLLQMAHQTYPKDKMEILVLDANSQDKTRSLIKMFCEQHKELNIKILDDVVGQRSAGLNKGIKQSMGEVIVRIDARSLISNDYIEKCVSTLLEKNADNVGGVQRPVEGDQLNSVQCAIALAMSHPFGVGNAQFRVGKKSGEVDSVYLGCFKREIFNKVGLFDDESPIITEDSDINYRIRRSGGKVYLDKDINVYYVPRERLRDLAKLYFRYGGARAGFLLKWKALTGIRQLAPPLLLMALVLLPLFFLFSPVFFYLWIFLCLSYITIDIGISLGVALKNKRWNTFPYLILVFPIMHFSWASGFWKRLIQRKLNVYWGY
ncbi:MAG: glycosyltransferase family 2 protein [Gammaproteobacteria bacterium]|nr:glycosyltransferase family 2 protein [Gammaproteobacteria bacterium]